MSRNKRSTVRLEKQQETNDHNNNIIILAL